MTGARPPSVKLDLRDLEPPGPMVEILEALARLAPGDVLEAQLPRRPVLLLPELEAAGHAYEVEELATGECRLRVIKSSET